MMAFWIWLSLICVATVPRAGLADLLPTNYCATSGSCTGGSSCKDTACRCTYGEMACFVNGVVCKPALIKIGETCPSEKSCPENGACDKVCKCKSGFVAANDTRSCVRLIANIGENCAISSCPKNSTCSTQDTKCACVAGFQASKDSSACEPIPAKIDEKCSHSAQCPLHGQCQSGVCKCYTGYLGNGTKCNLIARGFGDSCNIPEQCPGLNSECANGICRCILGYKPDSVVASCLLDLKLVGEKCDIQVQCYPNTSFCSPVKVCSCQPTYRGTKDKRSCEFDKRNIGDACDNIIQCPPIAQCNSRCECPIGYNVSVKNDSCVLDVKKLGQTCIDSVQCLGLDVYSICNMTLHKCICTYGYIYRNGTNRCELEAHGVGQNCTDTFQCPGNGSCVSGFCQCNPGYLGDPTNVFCNLQVVVLYDICNITDQCPEHALCADGICTCEVGYAGIVDICVFDAKKIWEPCSLSSQCPGSNSTCKPNGICQCVLGYTPSNDLNSCGLSTKVIYQACDINKQCPTNSSCTKGQCACTFPWVPKETLDSCYLREVPLKGICQSSLECVEDSSVCNVDCGVCECKKGYYDAGGYCELPIVGETCDGLCPENSYCDQVCRCLDGYLPGTYNEVCRAKLGSTCRTDSNCTHVTNAVCKKQSGKGRVCTCIADYTPVADDMFGTCVGSSATVLISYPVVSLVICLIQLLTHFETSLLV